MLRFPPTLSEWTRGGSDKAVQYDRDQSERGEPGSAGLLDCNRTCMRWRSSVRDLRLPNIMLLTTCSPARGAGEGLSGDRSQSGPGGCPGRRGSAQDPEQLPPPTMSWTLGVGQRVCKARPSGALVINVRQDSGHITGLISLLNFISQILVYI